jgi:hypothetical protein
MESAKIEAGQRELDRMLMVLWRAGYVNLEPEPPKDDAPPPPPPPPKPKSEISKLLAAYAAETGQTPEPPPGPPPYKPLLAHPTPEMQKLLMFRGVHPLYAMFLLNQLGIANRAERVQAMESVLELPRSVGSFVRVPPQDQLPSGPLTTTRLDPLLLQLGLATAEELAPRPKSDDEPWHARHSYDEAPVRVLTVSEKLRRLFDYDFAGVRDLFTNPVWAAGEVLEFNGDFNKYVTSKGLHKQEGIIFRHLLRLILLVAEFTQFCPPDTTEDEWRGDLGEISAKLTECCRNVDPTSTEKALEQATPDAADTAEEEA